MYTCNTPTAAGVCCSKRVKLLYKICLAITLTAAYNEILRYRPKDDYELREYDCRLSMQEVKHSLTMPKFAQACANGYDSNSQPSVIVA
ncbi:hypothetical protein J6590_049956 [Homalodisca vitripennis]|nr:hypothetical protein J6590_049956 [Homalodisca vitripennis]